MLLTIITPMYFLPGIKRYILSLFIEGKNLYLVSKENLKFDLSDNPKDKLQFHKEYFPDKFTYCQDKWCI